MMTLARGCGKDRVLLHGMVNIRWTGMLIACAQWTCAKLGGFAIMALATNGTPVTYRIRLDARLPTTIQNLRHHLPLSLDIAGFEGFHAWYEAGILHHVRHQFGRITANRIELQTRIAYEVGERVMCR
jgi:hypothetical protein